MLKEKVISRKSKEERKEEREGGRRRKEGEMKGGKEEGREGKTSQISLRLYLDCNSDFFSNQQTVESLNVFAKYNNSNNTEERDSTALS